MQFPEQITIGTLFFLFAYGAMLGLLQIVASRHRLVGLSLLGVRRPARGYLLGSLLLTLSCGWFFGTRGYEIFSPGPATSEFAFFLGLALLAALITTLLLVSLKATPLLHPSYQEVKFDRERGRLYLPPTPTPSPAICTLPGAGEGISSLDPLARRLAQDGFVVLAMDISTFEYPDILALIPRGVSYLTSLKEVDPRRIGVAGVDLGGDLALRAASGDQEIRAALALSPLLREEVARPGLDILAEMSYLQGMRWLRRLKGGRLIAQLTAWENLPLSHGRPYLLLYGERDRLAIQEARGERKVIAGEEHLSLPRSEVVIYFTGEWFRERLGE